MPGLSGIEKGGRHIIENSLTPNSIKAIQQNVRIHQLICPRFSV